mgnify:FL=1
MSLLIKGVQLVDGTGREPYRADVLIQKNLVSSIGDLKGRRVDKVIEGLGNYLTPGFIDPHSRSDHSLSIFTNPGQESFLRQGVTTIVGGQYGSSLAPIVYGTLESIRKWSDHESINVDWHEAGEFLEALDRFNLGINFATLAGHSTVRRDIVGTREDIDKGELEVLKKVLKDSVKQGALGFSSGLKFSHGSMASAKEILEIAKLAQSLDVPHVIGMREARNEFKKSFKEILKIAKSSKARVIIDDFKPFSGVQKEFANAIDELEKESNLYFLVSPHPVNENHIYSYLPKTLRQGKLEKMVSRVKDEKNKKAIETELKKHDLRGLRIISAPRHHFLVGKSLVDVAHNWGISYIKAMIKLMEMSELRATVAHEDVNENGLRTAMAKESALITSDNSGAIKGSGFEPHKGTESAFSEYLRTVSREGLLSIEDAIKKITSTPAKVFGIKDRGVVEEGVVADLVLVSKDNYEVKEVILGGNIFGEENMMGSVIKRRRY